jgi:hypothetical protein
MQRLPILASVALLAACGAEPELVDEPTAAATARASAQVADTQAALPGGFTEFPGAQEVSRTSIDQNGGSYILLAQQADSAPAAMVAFYRDQAEAAGIPISLEVSENGMHQIGGETPAGLNFSFTASPAGDGASSTLAIGQVAPE